MKQFNKESFLELVRTWNKKHNIIGRINPCELVDQAAEALEGFPDKNKYRLLIDVGAGPGWMAVAWLLMAQDNKAVCIEPDVKCSSFLYLLISSFPALKGRLFVDDRRFEDVPRETAESKGGSFFLVSRAFSPAGKLIPLFQGSNFRADPFFVFIYEESLPKGQRSRLKPLL